MCSETRQIQRINRYKVFGCLLKWAPPYDFLDHWLVLGVGRTIIPLIVNDLYPFIIATNCCRHTFTPSLANLKWGVPTSAMDCAARDASIWKPRHQEERAIYEEKAKVAKVGDTTIDHGRSIGWLAGCWLVTQDPILFHIYNSVFSISILIRWLVDALLMSNRFPTKIGGLTNDNDQIMANWWFQAVSFHTVWDDGWGMVVGEFSWFRMVGWRIFVRCLLVVECWVIGCYLFKAHSKQHPVLNGCSQGC